jgi:hypothetical protein
MILISKSACILFLLLICVCGNVLADVGECDPSVQRIKKTLLYQSGKENIQGNVITVTEVCTDQVVKVRSCSVISDLKEHLQQPCMNLVPQRLDSYDEIEYYERVKE